LGPVAAVYIAGDPANCQIVGGPRPPPQLDGPTFCTLCPKARAPAKSAEPNWRSRSFEYH